jgi:hypothetical protein
LNEYSILEVESKADLNHFIEVPFEIYKNNHYWVPQLISESRKFFDKSQNPFFLHSEAKYFIAFKNGKSIARIAGIINNRHNEFHNEKIAFFGFFECPDDSELARALLDKVIEYAKSAGMNKIMGPANFSSNDDWGFLVDGYDKPPALMMPYSLPYYHELMLQNGFGKAKDILAYYIDDSKQIPEKAVRVAELIRKKHNVEVRTIDLNNFDKELQMVREIYNNAWSHNWGFVPMTEEEIDHTADDFKKILDPELVLLAFVNGKPAGFSLALPDLNPVFKAMKGKLFPTGIFKFIWHTKIKKSVKGVRLLAMGLTLEYQRSGIDNIFYIDTYRNGVNKGYRWAELSWILEDNVLMNRALLMIGAVPYKRYRLYEKGIRPPC